MEEMFKSADLQDFLAGIPNAMESYFEQNMHVDLDKAIEGIPGAAVKYAASRGTTTLRAVAAVAKGTGEAQSLVMQSGGAEVVKEATSAAKPMTKAVAQGAMDAAREYRRTGTRKR